MFQICDLKFQIKKSAAICEIRGSFFSGVALIKKGTDLFVSFACADSFDPLQVVGAFEWARLDNAFCDGWANPGNVLKFS